MHYPSQSLSRMKCKTGKQLLMIKLFLYKKERTHVKSYLIQQDLIYAISYLKNKTDKIFPMKRVMDKWVCIILIIVVGIACANKKIASNNTVSIQKEAQSLLKQQ